MKNVGNHLLSEQRVQFEADLVEAQANCETVAVDGLYYLHADHLGRPQFATDPSGSVVWDMGAGVTPFGESVNLAGAFAQRLMFPGQYADVETGDPENGDTMSGGGVTLSHNWHRTYDPTLGRYLQSVELSKAELQNCFQRRLENMSVKCLVRSVSAAGFEVSISLNPRY